MEYYLPPELQRHINEYAKPMTRPDWRRGCCYLRRICKLQLLYISNMYLMYRLSRLMPYHNVIPYGRLQWDRHITDITPFL
jgi:hypothetical protein